jgi:hypothetical protein
MLSRFFRGVAQTFGFSSDIATIPEVDEDIP